MAGAHCGGQRLADRPFHRTAIVFRKSVFEARTAYAFPYSAGGVWANERQLAAILTQNKGQAATLLRRHGRCCRDGKVSYRWLALFVASTRGRRKKGVLRHPTPRSGRNAQQT
jgi:hypothetical protein